MEEATKLNETAGSGAVQEQTKVVNQTEAILGIYPPIMNRRKALDSAKIQSSALRTEKAESDFSSPSVFDFSHNEDTLKNRRARANALMDADCLPFLKLFIDHKSLFIDELCPYLKQPRDWLKISLLIRADFLEALDSTVRITSDGLTAWNTLNQLNRLDTKTG